MFHVSCDRGEAEAVTLEIGGDLALGNRPKRSRKVSKCLAKTRVSSHEPLEGEGLKVWLICDDVKNRLFLLATRVVCLPFRTILSVARPTGRQPVGQS